MNVTLSALVYLRELVEWMVDGVTGHDTDLPPSAQWKGDVARAAAGAAITPALGPWAAAVYLAVVALVQKDGGPRLDRWVDFGAAVGGTAAALGMAFGWWGGWIATAAFLATLTVTAAIRKSQETA